VRHLNEGNFKMTVITNPASPGAPAQVVTETPIRNPIAGISFHDHRTNPAVAWPAMSPGDAHVRSIPRELVDATGGSLRRR
jgi:hypothetical protein